MMNSCNKTCMGSVACTSTGHLVENKIDCDFETDFPIVIKGVCSREKIENMLGENERIWTQIFIPEVLCLPIQKPDIEQLLSVSSCVEIISQRVIITPKGQLTPDEINYEGIKTTGKKLIIEGILRQKVMYTAANKEQSVHAAHFDVPFSAFIVIPRNTELYRRFKIETCIEDIFISRCTWRQIFKNVTLFIKATPEECPPV